MDFPLPHSLPSVSVTPIPPADPKAVVDSDFPCRKCSYNLRGLTYGGRCPECGTPVGLSTVGDLLRYSDPNWLGTLSRGIRVILWGVAVYLVAIVAGLIVTRNFAINAWILVAASVVGLYGSWLVTEPDPSGLGEQQYARWRQLVRASLLVSLVGNCVYAMIRTFPPPATTAFAVEIFQSGTGLFQGVGEIAFFIYFRKLSLRIPAEEFASRARFLCWALGSTLIFWELETTTLRMVRRFGHSPLSSNAVVFLGCFSILFLLAFIIFWIMKMFFLYNFRNLLMQHTELSRRIWKVTEE